MGSRHFRNRFRGMFLTLVPSHSAASHCGQFFTMLCREPAAAILRRDFLGMLRLACRQLPSAQRRRHLCSMFRRQRSPLRMCVPPHPISSGDSESPTKPRKCPSAGALPGHTHCCSDQPTDIRPHLREKLVRDEVLLCRELDDVLRSVGAAHAARQDVMALPVPHEKTPAGTSDQEFVVASVIHRSLPSAIYVPVFLELVIEIRHFVFGHGPVLLHGPASVDHPPEFNRMKPPELLRRKAEDRYGCFERRFDDRLVAPAASFPAVSCRRCSGGIIMICSVCIAAMARC